MMLLAALVLAAGPVDPSPALSTAGDAARWIRSLTIETEHGVAWPVTAESPQDVRHDLYHGTVGVCAVLLELGAVAEEPEWTELAVRGANEILHSTPTAEDAGLYTGMAGHGWLFLQMHRAIGDDRWADAARTVVGRLDDSMLSGSWSDTTDVISGSAGVGLFLLHAADDLDDARALEVARRAGDRLLELAEGDDDSRWWRMTPDYERVMPNFSHGTAGIAFFLTHLGQRTKDPRYSEAALSGARHLQSIAAVEEDRCLIHHHAPGGEDLFYLGWCHGPAGTGRLFVALGTDDSRGWAARGGDSLIAAGLPGARTDGYWNNVGLCCGAAGIGAFAHLLHDATGDERFEALAAAVAADLIARAERVETGVRWTQAEHRVRPELLQAQTGYMQGAAGVALWLVRHHARSSGKVTIRLPESL